MPYRRQGSMKGCGNMDKKTGTAEGASDALPPQFLLADFDYGLTFKRMTCHECLASLAVTFPS